MAYWLVKSEPGTWSWDDHVQAGTEMWDGVRNHQAANNLRAMKIGDRAFFYHSVKEKKIVGVLEVVGEAYIDPTDADARFVAVDFRAVAPVTSPVSLADIKANPKLAEIALIKQSRLSVMPVRPAEWKEILRMGGGLMVGGLMVGGLTS